MMAYYVTAGLCKTVWLCIRSSIRTKIC